MASLAEFERELIVERTHAGLKSARARGRVGGRPKGLSHAYKEKAASILALYESEKVSNDQIRKDYKIGSKETLYKILAYARENRKWFWATIHKLKKPKHKYYAYLLFLRHGESLGNLHFDM